MPVSYPIFNTDPNLQSQAALLDQRQMLAQALLQRGLTPMQGHMAGDVYVGPHPLEALGNLVSAWQGNKNLQQVAQDRASLAAQAYAAQLQANEPQRAPSFTQPQVSSTASDALSGGGGPTNANAQKMAQMLVGQQPADPGAPPNPRNPLNLPAELVTGYQAGYIPKEVFETQAALFKPTEATVQARQGGLDPTQANRQAFDKTVTDPTILKLRQAGFTDDQIKRFVYADQAKGAEIDRKAGNQYYNFATGESGMVPKIPENANPVGGIGPNGALPGGVSPIPGALPMAQANAGATEAGKAPYNIVEGFDPKLQAPVKNYAGNAMQIPPPFVPGQASPPPPVAAGVNRPASGGNRTARTAGQVVPPDIQAQRDQERLSILRQERAKPTNSAADNAALDREIASIPGGLQSGPSLGAPKAADAAQEQLSKKFATLQEQNGQAQPTISYLQNIKGLAEKAATGQFTERLQLINSLLAPFSEKATDATTANNLLEKYGNQIVARLGQGGLGTDAARSILQSAYPNAKMNKAAINDAADNIIGAQEMLMAKAKLLSPHGNAKDPVAYQQAELAFDQAADPRIWQWKAIKDPAARAAFAKKLQQQDPGIGAKIQSLEKMGAL